MTSDNLLTATISMPLIACLVLLSCATSSMADQVRSYDWLTNGVKTGSLVVTTSDDGSRTTSFEFKDRGRGPEIQENDY